MKSLFNFYLEDSDKEAAVKKLETVCGEQSKGQLASYLRVAIRYLIETPETQLISLKSLVTDEYEYSAKKNKRSKL